MDEICGGEKECRQPLKERKLLCDIQVKSERVRELGQDKRGSLLDAIDRQIKHSLAPPFLYSPDNREGRNNLFLSSNKKTEDR